MRRFQSYKMDKTSFSVAPLGDESEQRAFWHAATPHDRLRALEFMRQTMYGYDPASARLQRILEIASLDKD
jgi:hypothetical protein